MSDVASSLGPQNGPVQPSDQPFKALFGNVWFQRSLVILGVIALPAILFVKQALFNPATPFLPPSWSADWALHPDQQFYPAIPRAPGIDETTAKRVLLEPVRFTRRFTIDHVPQHVLIHARALGSMIVTVNGVDITPTPPIPDNWKNPTTFDLAPLLRPGDNEINVLVSHDNGVAALLVEAPDFLTTAGDWQASIGPDFIADVPVVSPGQMPPYPGRLHELSIWRWGRWLAVGWLLCTVGLGGWVLVREIRCHATSITPTARDKPSMPAWVQIGVPAFILTIALWQNLTNTNHFRFHLGPDSDGHLEHIELVANSWQPRLATDGWQTYQPPLYYFVAAGAYYATGGQANREAAIKAAQYVGCLMGVSLVVVTWGLARRFFPDDPPSQWLAGAFVAFVPLSLTTNLQLSNQSFSAAIESLALLAMVYWATQEEMSLKRCGLLGGIVGLTLLSRFSGIVTLALGALVLGVRALATSRTRDWLGLAVYGVTAVLVSGWYYGRNIQNFGDPFYGNWQAFPIIQYPTYRSAGYFFEFSSVFFHNPNRAKHISWPDGTYAGFWADGTMTFFAYWMTAAHFIQSVTLFLAALPTVAMLVGLARTWASALRRPAMNGDLLLMAAPWWTILALWMFCLKIPATGGGSPRYLLALVPVFGIYLLRGRESLDRHLPWARWALDATLLLIFILSICVYRFGRFAA